MFRVLLKVDRVNIRVKQTVELHLFIKKGNRNIHHSRKQNLINGQALLSNSSQFLIDANNPVFELQVLLVMGKIKKKGGIVQINLNNYAINTSHRIIALIEKCPQANSTMMIDFVYMQTDRFVQNQPLISLQQLELRKHQAYLKEINDKNQQLLEETRRLSTEISNLMVKNQQLEHEYKHLQMDIEQNQNDFRSEINKMNEQHRDTCLSLENEKHKIQQILEFVHKSGDQKLMNQIASILQHAPPYSQTWN